MVRIPGFHPGDPGSSPGIGNRDYYNILFTSLNGKAISLKGIVPLFETEGECLVSWCNRLALWTLNPMIRVQIPARPFFYRFITFLYYLFII